jgi:nitrite reductase/ring-hydroxylating ferredoxin subunit
VSTDPKISSGATTGCTACPHATDRRTFLRHMALAVAGSLAVSGLASSDALAGSVRYVAPLAVAGAQRRYELPRADGVAVDGDNEVILARWQGHVYAFSLRCTHRGTTLVWHADESRVFCPKHKARFRPDGAHDSGRNTRALDRYGLRLEGGAVVVELDALYRVDEDPAGWTAAAIAV